MLKILFRVHQSSPPLGEILKPKLFAHRATLSDQSEIDLVDECIDAPFKQSIVNFVDDNKEVG